MEEVESGQKKRGRKPQEPESEPLAEAKANVTDPDSRIMKTRSGYVQRYNGQALVTQEQIIVAAELTTQENDVKQLHPMVEAAQENLRAFAMEKEGIGAVLADAGYCSEANLEKIDPEGPEYFIATRKDWKQRQALAESPSPRGRIPDELGSRDRMERKLLTQRGQIVEPVFGQIKTVRGITTFMRRGFEACAQEWKLICATHNLLKLWRSGEALV